MVLRQLLIMACCILALLACSESESEILNRLEKMRAKDYFKTSEQLSLIQAVDQKDLSAIKAAIGKGADMNTPGKDGVTPLFWALIKQNPEGLQLLLELGANPNVIVQLPKDFQEAGVSAMDVAARMSDSQFLKILLENGGDPNAIVNDWNEPVLHRAIMYRQLDNIKLLVEHGADVNHQDKSQTTPLMLAVTATMYESALYLLQQGADPTIKSNLDASPITMIERYGSRGIDTRTNDLAAYEEFLAELKRRGYLK
ncbi:MAG: ankyrin repeat domain-containing protein [Porticoccaceae bacterium]|nr:ankyrin repeat domain-containing protein [Porticoccaceae bacterium]